MMNLDSIVVEAILAEVAAMAKEENPVMREIMAAHIKQMAETNIPF